MRAASRSLFFLALAALSITPALTSPPTFAWRYDWRYFDAMGEISRRAVLFWHQVPLWNPYSCGGEVALANPQSTEASPTFLLILLFGTALGYKLTLILHTFFALDGGFRLGRRLGLSSVGALLAGLGYGLSGYLALHFSEGHVTFIGITLYPYLLLAYDRALDDTAWAIPTGLCAFWIVSLGGTFTPPMAAELLLVWATLAAIERRSLRPYALLAAAALVAVCCGAIRMLPVLQFIHDHPRPPFMRKTDFAWPWNVMQDLIAWRELAPVPGRQYWGHEYAARLPYLLLPLWLTLFAREFFTALRSSVSRVVQAIRGIASTGHSGHSAPMPVARKLFVLTLFAVLFTMGNFSPVAPWSLVQKLPVMRDLRVPTRHLILVALGLSLLAGLAWDELSAWLVRRRGQTVRPLLRRAGALLVFLVAADGVVFSALHYRGVYISNLDVPATAPRFYHVEGGWQSMRDHLFAGHGSLGCDEEAPLQRAEALDPGDVPQERLLDPGAGEMVSSTFSPNERVIVVELKKPTILLINSNWNEHWKLAVVAPPTAGSPVTDGAKITKIAGRLAVDLTGLPPGRYTLTVRYAPRAFFVGAVVTLISLPACLALFLLGRRRRRATETQPKAPIATG